jgi:hypothetical protein
MSFGGEIPRNPAQQEVLDLLGAAPVARPEFDAGLRHELRAELEAGLAPVLGLVPAGESLWLGKRALATVHGCEGRYLAEHARPFAWSPATARGAVAHKAIELGVHWSGEATALDLVDEAVARLIESGDGCGDWLSTCSPTERAEVRAEANERVATFQECFPPLKPEWTPVTESRIRAELSGGRVVLPGKVDLSLGRARGTTAGKVLLDLKTGGFSPRHLDDLRLYALIETLRLGTPPRLLAGYYLDEGRVHPEVVTEGLLAAAVRRTVDGAARIAALLHGGDAPELRPGPSCRWCPAIDDCDPGRAHLGELADDTGAYGDEDG